MPYLRLLRPHHWVKNVFVFAGLIFGKKFTEADSVLLALLGFACLCLASSTIYMLNDVHDREEDRLHPRKRNRPIASGEVTVGFALFLAALCLLVALVGSWLLNPAFLVVVVAYVVLQVIYTWGSKHVVILDVISIALGFVLRAIAGAVLVQVEISHWLVLCTFTLCLFMGFSKRRCELNTLAENGGQAAAKHRKTLSAYTPDLLNHMTTMTAGIAVVSFMLYATDERTTSAETGFGTNYLIYTLPMVVYAIFRFALLVEHGRVDGPTDVVLRDRPFQAALVLWGAAALFIIYRGQALHGWFAQLASDGAP